MVKECFQRGRKFSVGYSHADTGTEKQKQTTLSLLKNVQAGISWYTQYHFTRKPLKNYEKNCKMDTYVEIKYKKYTFDDYKLLNYEACPDSPFYHFSPYFAPKQMYFNKNIFYYNNAVKVNVSAVFSNRKSPFSVVFLHLLIPCKSRY